MLEPLLQVLIDSLVRHLAQKRQIRYADLFLLGDFEISFLDLWLSPISTSRFPSAEKRSFWRSRGLAVAALRLPLYPV